MIILCCHWSMGARTGSSRAWIAFVLAGVMAAIADAAPLERDLGQRLVYLRVQRLPDDLPAQPAGRLPACVADLRFVKADAAGAAAFGTWLKARATVRSPVFVLANAATSAELLEALAIREKQPGIVLVGIEAPPFKPDVAVRALAEDERRAYDALEKGVDISTLLADNPNKVRNDEASLAKERPNPPASESPGGTDVAAPGKPAASPVDATLQRAVHLHRALMALKKL